MQRLVYLFIALLSFTAVSAQTITIEEYVNTYKEIAIKEMIRTGVPASITLAQGIVETESGNSKLVKKSNNHFGIKCKETWTGPTVSHDDDAPGECFRKYENPEQSYIDHSDFLRTRKHYNFLFGLDPADYKAWAYGLKKAGYATNPAYPQMLIKYIEKYNLNEYSLIALGKKQAADPIIAKKDEPVAPQQTVVVEPQQQMQTTTVAVVEEVKKPAVNYPTGEFKINETKVVYAPKGTSFLAIAQQHNVPLKWLFDFNDLKETEVLEKDQLIYLQRKRRIGVNQFHVVASGETLYDIAQAEGIRLEALLQLNYLPVNKQPAPGEQLYLQQPAPAAPKLLTVVNTKERSELIITK
ncbi:glucosaminidase domain-containing protein [Lacibacter sediminis]|uniref:Peptidoglycan hydrolase n=1 Tax=Lacibacter sediminis TaxID=2760713 RepID=A0A7G5XIJ8_9BACT|nr:glucosaminidase domain-containing protein [Lacibacter sediminis]QNA45301.1 glucosaminidase domain-containing protein [Lacibacter sediminis]